MLVSCVTLLAWGGGGGLECIINSHSPPTYQSPLSQGFLEPITLPALSVPLDAPSVCHHPTLLPSPYGYPQSCLGESPDSDGQAEMATTK